MKDLTTPFFRRAKSIQLTAEEKGHIAHQLGIRVSDVTSKRLPSMTSTVFFKKMKALSLTPAEKATAREWLINAMEQKIQERWWLHPLKHMTSIVAGILIITISSGTLSYAAESAVPGDVLYPVKVNVNEMVRGSLKRTQEDQALWEAEKAERRLKEAEIIASTTTITDAQQEQIQKRFKKHTDALQTRMASMSSEKAIVIGQRFEAKLRAHGNAFEKMNAQNPERANRMKNLLADVQRERMKIEEHLVMTDVTSDESDDGLHMEDKMIARRSLQRSIEADIMASMPQGTNASIIDQEAPIMMMKAVPATLQEENDVPHNDTDDDIRDKVFSIEARMNVTKRKLRDLRKDMDQNDRPMPNDIEIRMMGAEQILDVATSQMAEGNIDNALRASEMALRHAEKARRGMKEMKNEE